MKEEQGTSCLVAISGRIEHALLYAIEQRCNMPTTNESADSNPLPDTVKYCLQPTAVIFNQFNCCQCEQGLNCQSKGITMMIKWDYMNAYAYIAGFSLLFCNKRVLLCTLVYYIHRKCIIFTSELSEPMNLTFECQILHELGRGFVTHFTCRKVSQS